MNSPTKFTTFVTSVFEAFNQAGIRYLVLRNYEHLPEQTDNDIDLLVSRSQREEILLVLRRVSETNHWKLCKIAEFACTSVFFYHEETLEQVHIDLMCEICWHSFLFGDPEAMLSARQPIKMFYKPAPAHETLVNVLTRLVYGGYVKEKYRPAIQETARQEKTAFVEALSWCLRKPLAETVVGYAEAGEWKAIEKMAGIIRKEIVRFNMRHPFTLAGRILSDCFRLMHRAVHVPGRAALILFDREEEGERVLQALQSSLAGTYQEGRMCVRKIHSAKEITLRACWPILFRNGFCFFLMKKQGGHVRLPRWCYEVVAESVDLSGMTRRILSGE